MHKLYNPNHIDFTSEPLMFGSGRNISRLDLPNEDWLVKAKDRLLGKLWFPSDFDLSKASADYLYVSDKLKTLYLKNLKFQTELDSIAARSITELFLPITTSPQLEAWFIVHGFTELNHSQSYADIIKCLPVNAKSEFDTIMGDINIQARAKSLIEIFEDLYTYNALMVTDSPDYKVETHKYHAVKSLLAFVILENMLFDTSFNTTFAFAENNLFDGPAKIVTKINADETSHYSTILYLVNRFRKDPEYRYIFESNKAEFQQLFHDAYLADLDWIDYCYPDDETRLLGMNNKAAKQYSQFNTYNTMLAAGIEPIVTKCENPIKWVSKYKSLESMQVAQKETSGTNYLIGQLKRDMSEDDWSNL